MLRLPPVPEILFHYCMPIPLNKLLLFSRNIYLPLYRGIRARFIFGILRIRSISTENQHGTYDISRSLHTAQAGMYIQWKCTIHIRRLLIVTVNDRYHCRAYSMIDIEDLCHAIVDEIKLSGGNIYYGIHGFLMCLRHVRDIWRAMHAIPLNEIDYSSD